MFNSVWGRIDWSAISTLVTGVLAVGAAWTVGIRQLKLAETQNKLLSLQRDQEEYRQLADALNQLERGVDRAVKAGEFNLVFVEEAEISAAILQVEPYVSKELAGLLWNVQAKLSGLLDVLASEDRWTHDPEAQEVEQARKMRLQIVYAGQAAGARYREELRGHRSRREAPAPPRSRMSI